MCIPGQPAAPGAPAAPPASTGQALAALHSALTYLATADATALTAGEQADCLRSLERAESVRTAAHATVLAAFNADCGYEGDGHGSARSWLRWQTRVTGQAAAAAMAWTRRLDAHPAVAGALAAAGISASWARQICDWTDLLPPAARPDADTILLAAAAGAELADLAGLAEEMRNRTARPDQDGDDDGTSRSLRLDLHYRGHGQLRGDLTPRCAAALQAILDALGKKNGPQDTRTRSQRDHDALEEGCRRLLAACTLPDRAGQPTKIQLHITLSDFLNHPAGNGSRAGHGSPAGDDGPPGYGNQSGDRPGDAIRREYLARILGLRAFDLTGPAPDGWTGPGPLATPGDLCDATIIPIVTGYVDHELLDQLAADLLRHAGATGTGSPPATSTPAGSPAATRLGPAYARELILRHAVALLSGPAGLASRLRTGRLAGPRRLDQPAPRHRHRYRHRPAAPAPRRHPPRHPLRLPRLHPAASRQPGSPHRPALPGRPHQPGQPPPVLHLPPPHRHPPMGLESHPPRRRHHDRHQPQPQAHAPQPQPAPGRLGPRARGAANWLADWRRLSSRCADLPSQSAIWCYRRVERGTS